MVLFLFYIGLSIEDLCSEFGEREVKVDRNVFSSTLHNIIFYEGIASNRLNLFSATLIFTNRNHYNICFSHQSSLRALFVKSSGDFSLCTPGEFIIQNVDIGHTVSHLKPVKCVYDIKATIVVNPQNNYKY